MPDDFLVSY